ncbi:hypothetical protein LPJ75_000601 [Coemansia sp. RSA 2598]|nr:hypothetical protein LPJ75_000601 [Coemansia sp. RSA 2598]
MTAGKSDASKSGQASQNAFSNTECGLCRISPGFLLYLRFGTDLRQSARRKIERYVKQVLDSEEAHVSSDCSLAAGRKRRRDSDDRQAGVYCSDDSELGCRKRQRRTRSRHERSSVDAEADEGAEAGTDSEGDKNGFASESVVIKEKAGFGLELVFYGKDAGFDIDTTADDVLDSRVQYERSTSAVVGMARDSLLGNLCFNCSLPGHEIRDCPMPPDKERIEANRSAFNARASGQFNGRLYLCVEEERHIEDMRKKYLPGQPLSQQLSEALGLQNEDDVPEYVGRMYHFGYPPAYLGSSAEQDPLAAAKPDDEVSTPPPSTPPLIVYNETADYEKQLDQAKATDAAGGSEREASPHADPGDSDEEGAISEDAGCNIRQARSLAEATESNKPRNFPLVRYKGLDLSRFDFTSDANPGRPLWPHRAPQRFRGQKSPRQNSRNRSPVYDDRFVHSERNARYVGDYYQDRRRSRFASGGHRSYGRRDRYGDEYRDSDGNWADMLNGYYRSADYQGSERQYADNQGYYGDDSRDNGYAGYDGYRDSPRRYVRQYYNTDGDGIYDERGYGQTGGYGNKYTPMENEAVSPSYPPLPAEPQPLPSWHNTSPHTAQQPATDHVGQLASGPAQILPKAEETSAVDGDGGGGSDVEDGECDMEESD